MERSFSSTPCSHRSRALPTCETPETSSPADPLRDADTGLRQIARRQVLQVVGDVMALSSHGDLAIYDALARMAQDFSLRHPLIDGHGKLWRSGPDADRGDALKSAGSPHLRSPFSTVSTRNRRFHPITTGTRFNRSFARRSRTCWSMGPEASSGRHGRPKHSPVTISVEVHSENRETLCFYPSSEAFPERRHQQALRGKAAHYNPVSPIYCCVRLFERDFLTTSGAGRGDPPRREGGGDRGAALRRLSSSWAI